MKKPAKAVVTGAAIGAVLAAGAVGAAWTAGAVLESGKLEFRTTLAPMLYGSPPDAAGAIDDPFHQQG